MDGGNDGRLVHDAALRDGVVAWNEDEVGEGGGSDELGGCGVDVVVEGYVALREGGGVSGWVLDGVKGVKLGRDGEKGRGSTIVSVMMVGLGI